MQARLVVCARSFGLRMPKRSVWNTGGRDYIRVKFRRGEASVLRRMAPAFAAYLEGHGRSPTASARVLDSAMFAPSLP